MPFVTLLLNKKVTKKLENIKDIHSISPQVNTERAHVNGPVQVSPGRRGLDWARPAICDFVSTAALVGSLSLALVDRQVFAEKVSDPQWKTWLFGFLPVLQ